jgi:drug/metabolite transporter (DMT)-like permease
MLPAVALGGATVAAVAALASGGALGVSGFDFAIIAVLGIVQAAFGLIAFVAGSRHLPAAPLVLLSLIEVVLAPIWVLIAYDEVPSALSLVGGGMILASVVGLGLVSARAGTR